MPFTAKKLTPIKTDSLENLGGSVVDLAKTVEDEFGQVASALQATEPDTIWNRLPPRPRRGTYAYADGTNWNPGQGEGPYFFNGSIWQAMWALITSIAGNVGAFTLGIGLTNVGNDIRVNLSKITASLGADVSTNVLANYFDGPSIAQGTTGTWFVSGTVTVLDTAGASTFWIKLWDGTTVIASAQVTTGGANFGQAVTLSGWITSPASNLKISVREPNLTTGKIVFNSSGNSKDSTISAIRIA